MTDSYDKILDDIESGALTNPRIVFERMLKIAEAMVDRLNEAP